MPVGRWLVLGTCVGIVCGAASALFLTWLDHVTRFRSAHIGMVYGLPIAGAVMGLVHDRFGQSIEAGNNLVIDSIHDGGPEIPLRMAPMVLIGTLVTHLFGGSAGREGTAVQMGASLTDWLAHRLKLGSTMRLHLLSAGVAGGFGSVFGTPIAGAIFGLEFVVQGRLEYDALVPTLIAAVVGDLTTRALGIQHTLYPPSVALGLTPIVLVKWLLFAAAIAAATATFIELTHGLKGLSNRYLPRLPLRMFIGGALIVGLWKLLGTDDYLGLGIPLLLRAFGDPSLPSSAFAAKLLFTVVTLGMGFLGGEVTPLFVVGGCLGNALAQILGLPIALGAGVGMAAAFAAASNTPVALSIMAVELLGANVIPHVAIVCVFAYVLTGPRSIYPAQRRLRGKAGRTYREPSALRDVVRNARSR